MKEWTEIEFTKSKVLEWYDGPLVVSCDDYLLYYLFTDEQHEEYLMVKGSEEDFEKSGWSINLDQDLWLLKHIAPDGQKVISKITKEEVPIPALFE